MEPDYCLSCESYRSFLQILEESKRNDLTRLRVKQEKLEQAVRDGAPQRRIQELEWIIKFYLDRLMINHYLEGVLNRLQRLAHQNHND